MAIDATKLELGPANVYMGIKPAAVLVTTMGSNQDVRLEAVLGGAAGNDITLQIVVPGSPSPTLSIAVTNKAIVATVATAGAAPSAAPTTVEGGAGNITAGTHTWKFTYVTSGVESLPSPASTPAITTDPSTVDLSAVSVGPTGTTARKIYRTVAGDAGDYKLVGTIPNNTATTFNDNIADASLGNAAPPSANTADQLVTALNEDPRAASLIKATRKAGDNGTGFLETFSATNLSGGSDTATMVDIGALGQEVQVVVASEAVPLLAAQTGSIPQDKVIVGGRFQITVPFAEIKLENYQRAFPQARLFTDGGSPALRRLEYRSLVGRSLRASATRVEIRKLVGGFESTDPENILVVLEASPVEGEVLIPYTPKDQRFVTSVFEGWPSPVGVWAYFGSTPI